MTNETKQTAMQQMYEELMAHEYTIPLELIVKCKELIKVEEEQIMEAHYAPKYGCFSEDFYNETYGEL